ncbi:membrane fusogenic activity family protein [Nocardiopsis terrae]
MVVDAVRTYLDAANGLTELSRKQAVAAAKTLLRADGAVAPAPPAAGGEAPPRVGQSIQTLAGELIETSQANRAAVADLVRAELGRALEQMDVVPRAEYERMARRVAELERRMAARHAVERVLAPRGGASSVLPAGQESASVAVPPAAGQVREVPGDEQRAAGDAESRERPEAEGLDGTGSGDTDGAGAEAEESATAGSAEEKGADGAAAAEADADTGDGAESGTAAKRTAPRGKGRTAVKPPRSRSTAKRPAKGKGAKK